MNKDRFYTLLQNPQLTNATDTQPLLNLVQAYPYFQVAHLMLLNNLKSENNEDFDQQLQKSAVYVPDRQVLFNLLHQIVEPASPGIRNLLSGPEPSGVVEKIAVTPGFQLEDSKPIEEVPVEETLDAAPADEIHKSELLDFDEPLVSGVEDERPVTVEFDVTDTGDENDQAGEINLIDRFIDENPIFKPNALTLDEQRIDISQDSINEDDGLATETLANIFLMQKLYDKAIFVYEKLILKYPEKSTYFASRIEEIRKKL